MQIDLRAYQVDAVQAVLAKLRSNPVLVMPTGTGKSQIIAALAHQFALQKIRVLVLTSKAELADDLASRVNLPQISWIYHSKAKKSSLPLDSARLVFGTYFGGAKVVKSNWTPQVVLLDECHHCRAKNLESFLLNLKCPIVGFTATPNRLDKLGIRKLFKADVQTKPYQWFVDRNYLADYEVFAHPIPPEIETWQLLQRDDLKRQNAVLSQPGILQECLTTWKSKALKPDGTYRSTLAFCTSISHVLQMTKLFRDAGVAAGYLVADMKPGDRQVVLDKFKSGEIPIVFNVSIATEGFDFPDCEVVALYRFTGSPALFNQIVGRASRVNGAKKLYLDHAGNFLRHGEPKSKRQTPLQKFEPKKKRRSCPHCKEVIEPTYGSLGSFVCHHCLRVVYKNRQSNTNPKVKLVQVVSLTRFQVDHQKQRFLAILQDPNMKKSEKAQEIVDYPDAPYQLKFEALTEGLRLSSARAESLLQTIS